MLHEAIIIQFTVMKLVSNNTINLFLEIMADNRAKVINKSRYCIDPFKLHKKNVSKSLLSVPEATADKWKTLDLSGYIKYFKHHFF